jgi:hypothetical protein
LIDSEVHAWHQSSESIKVWHNDEVNEAYLATRYVGSLPIAEHGNLQAHGSFPVALLEKFTKNFKGPKLAQLVGPSRIPDISRMHQRLHNVWLVLAGRIEVVLL